MSFPSCVTFIPLLLALQFPSSFVIGADGGADGGAVKKAAEALADAARIKRSAAGKSEQERLELMTKAAAAYEQVAKDFAAEAVTAAEAQFRAGEIHRTIKRNEEARRCFTAAAETAAAPEWSARAWLELGHIARRLHRLEEAFDTYGKVLKVEPQQRSQSVDALTWQGRVLIDRQQEPEGHALLLSIGTRFPDFPVDDVRNVDDVAVDWIRAGRIDEATKLVLDCVDRHTRQSADGKDPGDSVQRALERMKSREMLAATPKAK